MISPEQTLRKQMTCLVFLGARAIRIEGNASTVTTCLKVSNASGEELGERTTVMLVLLMCCATAHVEESCRFGDGLLLQRL